MKTIIQEIKVYDINDIKSDETLKSNVLHKWDNYDNSFYYDELHKVYSDVKKFVNNVKSDVNYLGNEIYGYRLYKWLINNLDHYWTEKNVYSKHIKDGKATFKSSYFDFKYSHSYGTATKIRTSKIKKVDCLENCFISGMCYEIDLLKEFINFIKRPNKHSTIDDLFNIDSNYSSCCDDIYEWTNSEEYILDHIEANNYTFDYSGKMINL